MFSIFILLFIAFNVAFAIFDTMWLVVSVSALGFTKYAFLFGLASFLHTFMIVKAWEKLKELEQPENPDEK